MNEKQRGAWGFFYHFILGATYMYYYVEQLRENQNLHSADSEQGMGEIKH